MSLVTTWRSAAAVLSVEWNRPVSERETYRWTQAGEGIPITSADRWASILVDDDALREWAQKIAERERFWNRPAGPTLPSTPPLPPSSVVYFVQADNGRIKIGVTTDIAQRMTALRTGSPCTLRLLATMPGGTKEEAELHRRFAAACVTGEWFEPTRELLDVIGNVRL